MSQEMIKASKTKLQKSADLRVSDSEKTPFKNGSFDLVTCTFSFHHYPNPRVVLSEIRRILSPDGRLIMADPLIFAPMRQLMNLFVPLSKHGTVRYYSKKEMHDLARSVGLNVTKWRTLNWHTYILVAECKVV